MTIIERNRFAWLCLGEKSTKIHRCLLSKKIWNHIVPLLSLFLTCSFNNGIGVEKKESFKSEDVSPLLEHPRFLSTPRSREKQTEVDGSEDRRGIFSRVWRDSCSISRKFQSRVIEDIRLRFSHPCTFPDRCRGNCDCESHSWLKSCRRFLLGRILTAAQTCVV